MDGRDFSLENLSDPAALQSQKSFPVIWRERTAAWPKLLVFLILKASNSFFFFLFGFKGQLPAAAFIPTKRKPITYMILRWLKTRQIGAFWGGLARFQNLSHPAAAWGPWTWWISVIRGGFSWLHDTVVLLCRPHSVFVVSAVVAGHPSSRPFALPLQTKVISLQQVLLIQEIILAKENIFIKECEYGEPPIRHH